MFDLVCALTVLIAVAPVTLVTILIVRCTRQGPVYLSQNVVGLSGRTFKRWCWAVPRRNQFAWGERFLACELSLVPALFNVLAGEMSLVGPSARTPQQHALLASLAARHGQLSDVRPGLIGVTAERHAIVGGAAQVELELNYVENWRFRDDLAVVARRAFTYPLQDSGLDH